MVVLVDVRRNPGPWAFTNTKKCGLWDYIFGDVASSCAVFASRTLAPVPVNRHVFVFHWSNLDREPNIFALLPVFLVGNVELVPKFCGFSFIPPP